MAALKQHCSKFILRFSENLAYNYTLPTAKNAFNGIKKVIPHFLHQTLNGSSFDVGSCQNKAVLLFFKFKHPNPSHLRTDFTSKVSFSIPL